MKRKMWTIFFRDYSFIILLGISIGAMAVDNNQNRTSADRLGNGGNQRFTTETFTSTGKPSVESSTGDRSDQWSTTFLKRENNSELQTNESTTFGFLLSTNSINNISTSTISNNLQDQQAKPKLAVSNDATNFGSVTELPSLHFDPYLQTHAYRSEMTLSFDDRGMWMLYQATNWFLNKLQPDQFPDYLLTDEDLQNVNNILLALKRNHAQWLRYQQGFIITAGICFLLTAIFTLCYLVYACCRCCCPARSQDEKSDKKRDSCKRHCSNILLAALTIFMTFAVACSYITNHYVHVALTNLPNNLRTSVDDVALYRDDTDQRIQKLLVQDFRTLNATISGTLDASSHVIIERVKQVTGAISLDHLVSIADRAIAMSDNLTRIENSMSSIRQDALKLRANLTRLRDWSFGSLQACLSNDFDAASEKRQNCETALSVLDSYKDIPETLDEGTSFGRVKEQLLRLAAYNLSALLQGPRSQFETLKLRFHDKITADKQAVTQRMNDLGNDLVSVAANISRRLQRIDVSYAKFVLDTYENEAEPYEYYRWIGGHVISAVLGLIVICFGLGLFFGVCGRRPSYYDDDCCVWPRGGKLYCGGILFGVLSSFIFMIIVIALFFSGGNGQVVVCQSLQHPSAQAGFMNILKRYSNIVADRIARDGGNPDVREFFADNSLPKLINGCSENKTLYRLLDFDRKYKLTNIKEARSEAFRQLDSYVQQLQDVELETSWTRLIPVEAEATLRDIQNHNIAPLPTRVIDELFINATAVLDFAEKISTLKKVKSSVSVTDQNDELQRVLQTVVPELEQMKDMADSLRRRLLSVAENLTLLNDQIPQLTKEVPNWVLIAKNAQGLLATNLTGYVKTVASDVVRRIQTFVDDYLQHISVQLDTDVSSCEPLAKAANAVVVSVCSHALQPFNAFWAAVGVFLLLSIPAIILASVLRDLYTNTDAYVANSCTMNGNSTHRNGRVTAFTTDCYDHYSRVNGSAHPKPNTNTNGSTNWRTPSFENVGSPPPPYQSPKRSRSRRR